MSIGQAMSVTAVQLVRVAAAVANGGRLVTPHLMKAVGGKAVEFPAAARPRPSGPRWSQTVRDAMITVVREGTGLYARLQGVEVGGKTGSAQVVTHARLESDKKKREYQPHGWFICFAPADRPRIAMAVMVEHGVGGMVSAAPVAGRILSRYFGVPTMGPGFAPPPDNPPVEPSPAAAARAQAAPPPASATARQD